jgi:hypothetical protein
MRTPDVGDQFVSVRHSILGKDVTSRVKRIDRKADAIDYVELEANDDPLQKKGISVGALTDGRMFSRIQS